MGGESGAVVEAPAALTENPKVVSAAQKPCVLVTGANGHVGREVCRCLTTARRNFLPIDIEGTGEGFVACDLTDRDQIARLFQSGPIETVTHLAAILPGAFRADPLRGAEVNLSGSLELMRQAVKVKVRRFVFASSMSTYGSSCAGRPVNENDVAAPDDPYGAAKRAVEMVGETLAQSGAMEFVSLRIARVIGPGIKKTSSPWRAQIFETTSPTDPIHIPFAPDAALSLVHVQEVARMLITLATAAEVKQRIYNTPVEIWEARRLKDFLETAGRARVELDIAGAHGGPICDGSRFTREFAFELRGLADYLSKPARSPEP